MDEEQLVNEAVRLLPDIVRGAHAVKACLPALAGLSLARAKAMAHVYQHGPIPVGELAHAVGLSMPAASELVDRLVEDGYAEREINPADRRQVLVSLTPLAMRLGQEIAQIQRARIRAALAQLEPEEWPIFLRSLQALADALRELPDCIEANIDAEQSERVLMKQELKETMGRNH